ncbi:MAG: hypothetical protein OK452_11420 [Thaumarchaeota archaeon]|nr:hypothetical protein [Nitrososphaerota archaeon]
MDNNLVSKTRIYASEESHKYYDYLCKTRQVSKEIEHERKEKGLVTFSGTPQAFFTAAAIGHMLQGGERYVVKGKVKELLLRADHWDSYEKEDLKRNFTYLAKLEYHVRSPDDVLQVVAELAERGIRHIWDQCQRRGSFEYPKIIGELRSSTSKIKEE